MADLICFRDEYTLIIRVFKSAKYKERGWLWRSTDDDVRYLGTSPRDVVCTIFQVGVGLYGSAQVKTSAFRPLNHPSIHSVHLRWHACGRPASGQQSALMISFHLRRGICTAWTSVVVDGGMSV